MNKKCIKMNKIRTKINKKDKKEEKVTKNVYELTK